MRLRDPDMIDPEVDRELAAIETALRGETVDPDLADLAELTADLSGMRPTLEEEFAAELDRRAAAGFGAGERRGRFAGTRERLAGLREKAPGWTLAPVAVSGIAVVAIAVAVVGQGGSSDDGLSTTSSTTLNEPAISQDSGTSASSAGGAAAAPEATAPAPSAGFSDEAGSGASVVRSTKGDSGPYASGQSTRAIERDAQLTLGTDPDKVQDVTNDVLGVGGRYNGIVLTSSIEDGPAGDAGAEFELLIPSDRLSKALADLSEVAEVRSREENTRDITAPTVTTQEHLQDARAEAQGLLKQLAEADTDSERASVKGQLAFQRQRIAALRSTLSSLERRANLSHVSLDVVTGDASSFGYTSDSDWGVGDALSDAGRILAMAAGITLVGLAILAPFALLALLFWLLRRGHVASARRRALEG